MAKGSSNSKGGSSSSGGKSGSSSSGGKSAPVYPANKPSTTGKPSGGGRTNNT